MASTDAGSVVSEDVRRMTKGTAKTSDQIAQLDLQSYGLHDRTRFEDPSDEQWAIQADMFEESLLIPNAHRHST